jgi:hypothetical protein
VRFCSTKKDHPNAPPSIGRNKLLECLSAIDGCLGIANGHAVQLSAFYLEKMVNLLDVTAHSWSIRSVQKFPDQVRSADERSK